MADRGRPPGGRPPHDRGVGGGGRGDRPWRPERPYRPDGPRPPGSPNRPQYGGDRPQRGGDRPQYGGDRPQRGGDRPQYGGDRPQHGGDRRPNDRPPFDRSRPPGRPWREDGPRGDFGPRRDFEGRDDGPRRDLPRRDFGPRREDGPRDDRPAFERPRYGERPPRRPWSAAPPDRRPGRSGGGRDFGPPDRRASRGPEFRGQRQVTPPDETGLLEDENELIAGRRPVEEAFAARRDSVRLLVVPERRAALEQLVIHATTLRIPVVELEGGSLTSLAGFDGHQGVALVARPRPNVDLADIVAHARQRGEAPFVLVLDSLEDPQNFGTLLRSAEAVGVDGVVYPTRRAAPLSPAAIKASAGATEHLLLAPVDDLAGALVDLRGHGLRIVGADEDAALDFAEADLRGPLVIVVGSEGRGISGPVRKRLDLSVRIPMRGKLASLNASVAGSLLLFAASAQRPAPKSGVADQPTTSTDTAAEEPTAVTPPRKDPSTADQPAEKPRRATRARKVSEEEPAEAESVAEPAPRSSRKAAATAQEATAVADDELLPTDTPTTDGSPVPARKAAPRKPAPKNARVTRKKPAEPKP